MQKVWLALVKWKKDHYIETAPPANLKIGR